MIELKEVVDWMLNVYQDYLETPPDYEQVVQNAQVWLSKSVSMSMDDFSCWFMANFKRRSECNAYRHKHQEESNEAAEIFQMSHAAIAAAIRMDEAVEMPVAALRHQPAARIESKISAAISAAPKPETNSSTPGIASGGATKSNKSISAAQQRLRERLASKKAMGSSAAVKPAVSMPETTGASSDGIELQPLSNSTADGGLSEPPVSEPPVSEPPATTRKATATSTVRSRLAQAIRQKKKESE